MKEIDNVKLILLPGLDGTGRLFEPLLRELPKWVSPIVISYPTGQKMSYDELASYVLEHLPRGAQVVILAESFSGPIAIKLAALGDERIKGIILCCTFSRAPRLLLAKIGSLIPPLIIFKIPIIRDLATSVMLGFGASKMLGNNLREAVLSVKSDVLSHRFSEIARVDVSSLLNETRMPVCVIEAASDRLIPRGAINISKESKYHLIEGSHLLLQSRARESAKNIIGFIETL